MFQKQQRFRDYFRSSRSYTLAQYDLEKDQWSTIHVAFRGRQSAMIKSKNFFIMYGEPRKSFNAFTYIAIN